MNIVLVSSTSKTKIDGTEKAFRSNGIDCIVRGIDVSSDVSNRPIDDDMIVGALNRNDNLRKVCQEKGIEYDFLVSIEGGYPIRFGFHTIETVSFVEDKHGHSSIGFSRSYPIGQILHSYVSGGNSINKLIEANTGVKDNKQTLGIVGTITSGKIPREEDNYDAVESALIRFVYKDNYNSLETAILRKH